MSADDRLKVIARHMGAGRNGFHTSIAMRLCSSENQHSDTAQGGVVHPQIGSSSDARKPRSKPVKSVIPKSRYAFLPSIYVDLPGILLRKFISIRKALKYNVIVFMSEDDTCTIPVLRNKSRFHKVLIPLHIRWVPGSHRRPKTGCIG
jgi:hypothetical protein